MKDESPLRSHGHEREESENGHREHADERTDAHREPLDHEKRRSSDHPHPHRSETHSEEAKRREIAREHTHHEQVHARVGKHAAPNDLKKAGDSDGARRAGAGTHGDARRGKTEPSRAKHAAPAPSPSMQNALLAMTGSLRDTPLLRAPFPRTALIAIAAAVAVLVAIVAFQCSRPAEEPHDAEPTTVEAPEAVEPTEPEPEPEPFEPEPAALDAIPTGKRLQTFSLAESAAESDGAQEISLSDDQASAIMAAIDAAEEEGDVSLVLYNLNTGAGIGYNVDGTVYGASSFKAPYALYVCETKVEPGLVSLDDAISGTSAYDPSSYYNGGAYQLSDLIESAIVYSDNNAFGSLRDAFDDQGYDDWALDLGLDDALYRADSWYPWYCARTSAKVWTEMYRYLQTESEAARYLGELTGETEVSFLRDALEGTGAVVQDKAGWCADSDPLWNGLCDAGIVTIDGTPYVMSVMTGMADSEENRELHEDIAAAVFDAREVLE
ncbi:MAG: serine hydrolase [Slackia sp.]|nr:serine hydrolase [Slackia sp.]